MRRRRESMSNEDFAARLQAAVARHVGAPGTIHDLQRLTGGANKTTWSFDADVAGARAQFILQLASARANDESNPLAGVSPHLTADEDARLMIAAVKAGVPAPRVRAILQTGRRARPRLRHRKSGGRDAGDAHPARGTLRRCARHDGEAVRLDPRGDSSHPGRRSSLSDEADAGGTHRGAAPNHRVLRLSFARARTRAQVGRAACSARTLATRWCMATFARAILSSARKASGCVLDWEIGQSGDPMQDLGWVCVKTWRFGGQEAGRRLRHARGSVRGVREGQRTVRRSRARALLGGLRQRALGNRMLQPGHSRNRGNGIERCAIGRRVEEPLWDFLNLIEGRD